MSVKRRRFLLVCGALLAAGSAVKAADLPIAAPVDYVRICDAFGAGFYYLPDTDTCLRVGGRVRVEGHYVDAPGDDVPGFDIFELRPKTNSFTTRARGYIRLDARTQTDLGLIRAYLSLQLEVGPRNKGQYPNSRRELEEAFIQIDNDLGTFTTGHTSSFFDFFGSNTFGTRVFIDDNTTEQTLFAYTLRAGGGLSATISFEDPASGHRRLNPLFAGERYEGQEWPDVVGNVRIDQGWGSAQVMGVLHPIHDKEGLRPLEGADDADALGWAVGAGASFDIPGGFGLAFQANYADGALGYITNDIGGAGDFHGPDAETNTAWNVRGGVTAGFTPTVAAHIDASYTDVTGSDDQPADPADFQGVGDYHWWAIAANVVWTPVPGLSMGPEVAYEDFEFDDDAHEGLGLADEGEIWGAMFRIQRDF